MSKADVFELEGVVTEAYPNAMFEVTLQNGRKILATISGDMTIFLAAGPRASFFFLSAEKSFIRKKIIAVRAINPKTTAMSVTHQLYSNGCCNLTVVTISVPFEQ